MVGILQNINGMEGLMEKSFRVKVVGAVTGILNGQKGDCQNTAINYEIIRKLDRKSVV